MPEVQHGKLNCASGAELNGPFHQDRFEEEARAWLLDHPVSPNHGRNCTGQRTTRIQQVPLSNECASLVASGIR